MWLNYQISSLMGNWSPVVWENLFASKIMIHDKLNLVLINVTSVGRSMDCSSFPSSSVPRASSVSLSITLPKLEQEQIH